MCLILFAWRVAADFPLALAANRDEAYRRPALPLARWREDPEIIGGRDAQAGGGWLACHADGRFAAVTNVRQPRENDAPRSRGSLVQNYFASNLQPIEFIKEIQMESYAGFNLIVGNRQELCYGSNRNDAQPVALPPGVYGLSNHRLDTPWPKLRRAKAAFVAALATLPDKAAFFRLLADRDLADDAELPQTGVPFAVERMLSAIFIATPDYGTRASTLMLAHTDGHFSMLERSFGPEGRFLGEVCQTTA
ncbi:MAG: NRDE family protein [Zoogloeaceae bacterium]|jgi:uncharacterized protein with NRDE domain|nr:NRDE family protein [Zoogloeaceae bacterium]